MTATFTDIIFAVVLVAVALLIWKAISFEFYKGLDHEQKHKELLHENRTLRYENAVLKAELSDPYIHVNITYRGRWDKK